MDNRAFNDEELKKLSSNGELYPFVKLVKEHEELQLCFRGNGNPKYISIYYDNRQVFKVNIQGRVEISYRTARYWEKCENKYITLCKKYHFKPDIDFESFLKSDNLVLHKNIEKGDNYEEIYKEVLSPMLNNYSENKDKFDYFKKKCEDKDVERNHEEKEKKAQQNLYDHFKQKQNGYFFYDLEYHQKGSKSANEPDMLGVYFDENGKPLKIVFVEVKSTKTSISDPNPEGSGLYGHLLKSKKYIIDEALMKNRKKEALDIMKNYATLELRGLKQYDQFDENEFDMLEPQVLFLFTNDVIGYIEDNNIKRFGKKIDVGAYDCSAYVFEETDLIDVDDEELIGFTKPQLDYD